MFTFHEGSSSKEQDAYKGESDHLQLARSIQHFCLAVRKRNTKCVPNRALVISYIGESVDIFFDM